jgi:putative glutathione S-transferase
METEESRAIVNNSDDDLMRILNREFDWFTESELDLYPEKYRAEIEQLNELIYETVNDGVYRAGFATSQRAYEQAVYPLFETLDQLEARLSVRRYLFGDSPLETDWRLFVSLIRSMRFTMAISNATSAGSLITRACAVIFVIFTRLMESPRP